MKITTFEDHESHIRWMTLPLIQAVIPNLTIVPLVSVRMTTWANVHISKLGNADICTYFSRLSIIIQDVHVLCITKSWCLNRQLAQVCLSGLLNGVKKNGAI